MSDLPSLFAALSDPTRFAIVERLMDEGELSAGTLGDGLPISAPAISRHLKVLSEAGVVVRRIDGQRRFYSVRRDAIAMVSNWTLNHRDFWAFCHHALQGHLKRHALDGRHNGHTPPRFQIESERLLRSLSRWSS